MLAAVVVVIPLHAARCVVGFAHPVANGITNRFVNVRLLFVILRFEHAAYVQTMHGGYETVENKTRLGNCFVFTAIKDAGCVVPSLFNG